MNPIKGLTSFFGERVFKYTLILSIITMVLGILYLNNYKVVYLSFVLWLLLIVLSSIVIWRAGDYFSFAAKYVENRYNIPQSVKAAVIDAIASSFPEFAVAVIAVLVLGHAEVGIATIVGSALYNVLVIPSVVGIVAITPVLVSKEVVWRDCLLYLVVVVILLGAVLLYPTEWGGWIASIFLILYVGYIFLLHQHYRKHQKSPGNQRDKNQEVEISKNEIRSTKAAWLSIVGMMLLMGVSSHVLVEASIALGDLIGVHKVVMAFVVIAAGTSVPDMVLSIISAKNGQYDAAISNVFGSNIFDICVCLSLPIVIALLITGKNTPVDLPQVDLVWLLLGSTIVAFFFFLTNNYTLTKWKSWLLGIIYIVIVVYALMLS